MMRNGAPPRRKSLAPYMRLGIMVVAITLLYVFVVAPYSSTEGLTAPTSDRILTVAGGVGHSGSALGRARTPFDLVYMWVNGSDPEYAANRAKHGGLKRVGDRDRDNGELRYSLRSLDMYMPWFTGTLHFVHQNLPCWLNLDHPRLNIVHHRQIFTDQEETLPTFSSDAIECHLHRIPGLQRLFVLMNDDFFLGRATSLTDFVLSNGDPVLYFEKYAVRGTKQDHLDLMKKGKKSWLSKIYHTKSLLVDHFGVSDSNRYHFLKHSPTIMDRDRNALLWKTFPEAIAKTIRYRHRRPDGLSMTWLHHHFCLLDKGSSCYVMPQALSDKEARFIKAGSTSTKKLQDALRQYEAVDDGKGGWGGALLRGSGTPSPPKFFTINDETDVGKKKHVGGVQYAYKEWLPRRFPTPSQWELPPGKDRC